MLSLELYSIKMGEILIAERAAHKHQGGCWEFPGGKVEAGENAFFALQRELKEELDIEIVHAEPWLKIPYQYSDQSVLLDTWIVKEFTGEARGMEGQPIRWVEPLELNQLKFPDANEMLIDFLISGNTIAL